MYKSSNCNRTRRVVALFLCVLFCQVSSAVGCSFERMFHMKHQSQCLDDCVYVNVLDDGKTVELITTVNGLSSLSAMHRAALKSLNYKMVKTAIPLNQPQFVDGQSGLLSGCRYGYINYGSAHGLRDGSVVTVRLQTRMTAVFRILTVEDQRAFGVYDAQAVELDHT
jgi:hypothetical protein